MIGGVSFVHFFPEKASAYVAEIQDRLSFINNITSLQLALFLFVNNGIKTFIFAITGVLFAFPTVLFLVINGAVLGFVAAVMYPVLGASGLFSSLFFHGIFELSAVFIASGIGIFLGVEVTREVGLRIISKDAVSVIKKSTVYKKHFLPAVYTVLVVAIPLLVIAAIIETVMLNILKG